MEDIKVNIKKMAGLPYDGTLAFIFTPGQRQILEKGKDYRLVVEGFTFAEKDTGKQINISEV